MDAEMWNEDEGHRAGDRDTGGDPGALASGSAESPERPIEHEALGTVPTPRRRTDPASGLLAGGGGGRKTSQAYSIPILEGRLAAVLPPSVPSVLMDWYGISVHPNTVRKRIAAGTLVATRLWAAEGNNQRLIVPLNEIIASWGLEGVQPLDGPGSWFVRTKR